MATFYQFWDRPPRPLEEMRAALKAIPGLKGLVLMADEGINATISGEVEAAIDYLEGCLGQALVVKHSRCQEHPFRRWKVEIRPEIVTTGGWGRGLGGRSRGHLTPQEWDEARRAPNTVLIDVRNRYELRVGRFPQALDPGLDRFSDFPAFLESANIPRHSRVLMYCTGGIRCEKAQVYMEQLGYTQVEQLQGGILKYLQERPRGDYQGECFVFDERVALDGSLEPSRRYRLCEGCGQPQECDRECACQSAHQASSARAEPEGTDIAFRR